MDNRSSKPTAKRSKRGGNYQYRLKEDEAEMLERYRGLKKEAEASGIDVDAVKHGWLKSDKSSLFVTNPLYKSQSEKEIHKLRELIIKEVEEYAPSFIQIKRQKKSDSHLMLLDPADVHIGKLCSSFETGEEYNNQIAVKRVLEGSERLLDRAESWNLEKIIIVGGNDILHTDNPKASTTAGTHQDTADMWYNNFRDAYKVYIDVIDMLLNVADVHFMYNPSNHDYMSGFFLANIIQAHYRNNKNITFDVSPAHRKYFRYHTNLIGSTHGDGAKVADLPLLMAQEAKEWSDTKHRYIYTHHVHHKTAKDLIGCTVESLRSPSGTDSWHHQKGYQHNPKAIEAFMHHPHLGQVARFTHIF